MPGTQRGVEPAAAVGQHHRLDAGRRGRTYAVHDRCDAASLIEVRAAQEDQQALVAERDRADRAAVAGHGRSAESGQLGDRDLELRRAQGVGGGEPARSHDEGGVVLGATGALVDRVGGLLGTFLEVLSGVLTCRTLSARISQWALRRDATASVERLPRLRR